MTEKLLHFIWQFQYFNTNELKIVDGEVLQIVKQGILNQNQGPDFLNATLVIENVKWVGNIELHINASDWRKHHHQKDKNYNNVILHVVWNNDEPILMNDKLLPTLILQDRVPKVLLQKYEQLMNEQTNIPCQSFLPALSSIGWTSWKERLVVERLEQKSAKVLELLEQNNHHWEEVFWQMLTANFGIKVNAESFENVAKSISVNILAKHKNQIHQLEALLFGQAGLLDENFVNDYPKLLQREYKLLQHKYQLKKPATRVVFLRMRPASFPTIRLAQLAMLIYNSVHLFSKIKEQNSVDDVKKMFSVTANDYWHYHYQLDEASNYKVKNLGDDMIDSICINTIVPVLFAYGLLMNHQASKDKAILWLQHLSAENNSITKTWKANKIENATSFDSQALIQLTNHYCKPKRCLQCAIGNQILKKT